MQKNIETTGFRSLREGEEVEYVLVIGEDGKKKAFNVTGPGGASPLGSTDPPHNNSLHQQQQQGHLPYNGRSNGIGLVRRYDPSSPFPSQPEYGAVFPPTALAQPQAQQFPGDSRGGGGGNPTAPAPPGFYPPIPHEYVGYYPISPGGFPTYAMIPRGRGQFFPGGKNWVGARPPPPGQPGFSSGLQVVVHNLPWDCTWQQLKEAFADCGDIDRADVVFDSRGRSRGFGVVRFPTKEAAEKAVDQMNNRTIGGRVVSVRLDRFA